MKNLNDVFEVVKRRKFLIDYTGIEPDGGINHRFTGKGTNAQDKRTGLTDDDKTKIKAGLEKLEGDIKSVRETL